MGNLLSEPAFTRTRSFARASRRVASRRVANLAVSRATNGVLPYVSDRVVELSRYVRSMVAFKSATLAEIGPSPRVIRFGDEPSGRNF